MYGKLRGGVLRFAPNILPGDGVNVWNPPEEMYLEQGWKPVVMTEPPDDYPTGYSYESGWEEQDKLIVQIWTLTPLPDEIDDAEALAIILGGGDA